MTGKSVFAFGAESTRKRPQIHLSVTLPSRRFYLRLRDQSLSMAFVVAVGSGICWIAGRVVRGFSERIMRVIESLVSVQSIEFTLRRMIR